MKEQIFALWDITKDVWTQGIMGIDIGQIIIALSIFFVALILRGFFARFIINRLHALTRRTKSTVDDQVIDAMAPPLRFIPVIVGLFFAFEYIELDKTLLAFERQAIKSMVAFVIFWSIFRALTPLSHITSSLGKLLTPMMMQWIFKAMRIAVIFLGLAVILEIWGIKVAPLLAGFGLFGVAVALGAQDFFKNLIAGMTIIAEKRFSIGDWIKVDGVVEGTVENIGFRSTSIRRFDKAPVHVANAQLSDAAVTNFTRMSHRRIYWVLGVTYSTTTAQLKTIRDGIMSYIEAQDSFDKDVSTFVRIDSFNSSSIDIMVYCFTKTVVWGEWLEIKEDFAFEIKRVVEEQAGASFAFPSTSLYVEQWPDGQPQAFTPPENKPAKTSSAKAIKKK